MPGVDVEGVETLLGDDFVSCCRLSLKCDQRQILQFVFRYGKSLLFLPIKRIREENWISIMTSMKIKSSFSPQFLFVQDNISVPSTFYANNKLLFRSNFGKISCFCVSFPCKLFIVEQQHFLDVYLSQHNF